MQRQLGYLLTRSHAFAELNDSYAILGDQIHAMLWVTVMGFTQRRVLTVPEQARLQDLKWRQAAKLKQISAFLRRYFTN